MIEASDKIMIHDLTFTLQVACKVFAGLFLSPDGIAVMSVFVLGGLAFWLKSKVES